MKAIVLAAGRGSRLQEDDGTPLEPEQARQAEAGRKALMPVGRHRLIDHVFHSLAEAGIREIAVVIAGDDHVEPAHSIRRHCENLRLSRIALSFEVQQRPDGTADAVLAAAGSAAGGPALVLNSDNIYPADVLRVLTAASGAALPGFECASLELPMDRIGAFALVESDRRGCLSRIQEKPGEAATRAAGPRALISMNVWRFDEALFAACRDVPWTERNGRNEKELPKAAQLAADRGHCIQVIPVRGRVIDITHRRDVPHVQAILEKADVRL